MISLSSVSLFSSASLWGKSFEQKWPQITILFTQSREVSLGIDWLFCESTFHPSAIFPLATAVFVGFLCLSSNINKEKGILSLACVSDYCFTFFWFSKHMSDY